MNDLDWELFDRYLAGVATPAERERFERWLAHEPDREMLLSTLGGSLAALEADVTQEELASLWEGLAKRTGLAAPEPRSATPTERRHARFTLEEAPRLRWRVGVGIATAAAVTAGVLLAGRDLLTDGGKSDTEARLDLLAGSLGLEQVREGSLVTLRRSSGAARTR